MSTTPYDKLLEMGIKLPNAAAPAGSYVRALTSGKLVFISGQLPFKDDKLLISGKVGAEVSVESGKSAARQCAINLVAALDDHLGDLSKVKQILKLTVFVASTPEFTGHAEVANGASDFLAALFGEAGKHTRMTIGVSVIPLNAPVAIDMIAQI
jgi:enamine deaminase RidA (YjgF/YER057c/UK114 family)